MPRNLKLNPRGRKAFTSSKFKRSGLKIAKKKKKENFLKETGKEFIKTVTNPLKNMRDAKKEITNRIKKQQAEATKRRKRRMQIEREGTLQRNLKGRKKKIRNEEIMKQIKGRAIPRRKLSKRTKKSKRA